MRKAEKVYVFLIEKMNNIPNKEHYSSMSPFEIFAEELSDTLDILHKMSDEEFDKIFK